MSDPVLWADGSPLLWASGGPVLWAYSAAELIETTAPAAGQVARSLGSLVPIRGLSSGDATRGLTAGAPTVEP